MTIENTNINTDHLKAKLINTAEEVGEFVTEAVKDTYNETSERIEQYVKKNPMLSVGIAAAVGAVIALVIRR